MSRIKLRKAQRSVVEIIEQEGGRIMGYRKGGSHIMCDYELGKGMFFTATLPGGSTISPRWILNFRSQLRGNRNVRKGGVEK